MKTNFLRRDKTYISALISIALVRTDHDGFSDLLSDGLFCLEGIQMKALVYTRSLVFERRQLGVGMCHLWLRSLHYNNNSMKFTEPTL